MAFASRDRSHFARRQKLGPLALTILLHIVVVAVLLFYKAAPIPRMVEQSLKTIMLPPAAEESEQAAKAETKQEEKAQDSASAEPQPTPEPPVEKAELPEPPIQIGPSWLRMSRADYAASDISKMDRAKKGSVPGPQADSAAAYGPGDGPGGATLYNPDWFRKPTSAELNGYLNASMPRQGWGLIACQTIARNRVDNCRTLGEFPAGSGYGRAVREAAWQFQILPPRVNGKPQIGAWVRIRISYGSEAS